MNWPPIFDDLPWLRSTQVERDRWKLWYGPISLLFGGLAVVYFNWRFTCHELDVPVSHRPLIAGFFLLYLALSLLVRSYKYVPAPHPEELLFLLKKDHQGYYLLHSNGPQRVWIWFDTAVTGIFTMRKHFEFVTETKGMRARFRIVFIGTPTPKDMQGFYSWYRTLKRHEVDWYGVGDTRNGTHSNSWRFCIREALSDTSPRAFTVTLIDHSGWTP
ncbi:hypothetical protein KBD34_04255 [Patescibacteria group bacterium]|nr:hypothetical protein [Patescibacteria group bacterium]